jgi:hypothetical protein
MDPWCLRGRWRLDRTVVDHTCALSGYARGTLRIGPSDTKAPFASSDLRFFESGDLTWADRTTNFSRTTLLRTTDGIEWWMHFSDGRPFHPWRPGELVVHPCGPDRYEGRIDVLGPDRMTTVWQVTGPAKDHTYRTTLCRLDQ